MFYLSKEIDILINKIGARAPKRIEGSYKLGFGIDLEARTAVVENLGGLVPKAISKGNDGYVYEIGVGLRSVSALEWKRAEQAKHKVVETLATTDGDIGIGLFDRAKAIAEEYLVATTTKERAMLMAYLVAHDTVGYGPFSILMEDRGKIEEMETNSPTSPINIYHADYGRCATNLRFLGENEFRRSLNRLIYDSDKELGEETPIIDAQVGNARVHAQIKPFAQSGAVASIRLTDSRVIGFDYLVRKGTTDFDVLAYLWLAMDAGMNIMIAGSPASGKTTLMSAMFGFVPRTEKVLTIEEEVNELKIRVDVNNSVALYGSANGKTSTREQIKNALRMRPDRLVVGEVRGSETRELFAGANLGIPFMTTMHSNEGGMEIIKKLMIKPMDVEVRALSSLDVVIYMRHIELSRRVLDEIYEYRWLSKAETDRLGTVIEESDSVDIGIMASDGKLDLALLRGSKVIGSFSKKRGISIELAVKELQRRAEFLRATFEACTRSGEMLEKVQGYA